MIYEYISLIIGIAKMAVYKILNFSKIQYKSMPRMNSSFKIAMKKNTKMLIGKKMRTRNNVSFRIYDKGIVTIGDNCFFNDNCSINCQQKIEIGNNVMCGQNVVILDHDHDYKNDIHKFIKKDVKIGNNVWIGANTTILKGVTIGDNAIIGAGTLISKDIEENSVVYDKRNIKAKEK